jgi:hypothetical protein
MRKFLAFSAILLVLSLSLVSTVKAGGTINIYYAGFPNSQVRNVLDQFMPKLTFVNDPSIAEVFVLNGVIPNNEIISKRIQSGESGLILFLSPEITSKQIQMLLGIQDTVSLFETTDPVSVQPIKNNDASLTWMNEIDWTTTPQVENRISVSGINLIPLIQTDADHSAIIGFMFIHPNANQPLYTFIITPVLNDQNIQFQNWKYFNFLISGLVDTSDRRGLSISPPTPSLSTTLMSNNFLPAIISISLLVVILIIGIILLWKRKTASSSKRA